MVDFSLIEKFSQLKDVLLASPFLLFSLIMGIVLLVVMLISIKKNGRISNIVLILSWVFIALFIIIKYYNYFFQIFDRLFGRIVEEIYFPSLSVYTIVLLISNLFLAFAILKKKMAMIYKSLNIIFSFEINFMFIMILDTIVKDDVNIYDKINAYSNSNLLILLEFSMMIFVIWMLILFITFLIRKFAKKTILVDIFKESDYEILELNTINDSKENTEEIVDLEQPDEIIDIK